MDDESFKHAVLNAKIPVLVLDQKWHRLFAISGKPEEVKMVENELNELLAYQGKLNTDLKGLQKVKADLMHSIVDHMEAKDQNKSTPEGQKKAEDDKRLMDEVNEKIAACEDELLELPKRIQEKNRELMMLTMSFSYNKLRTNASEIKDIAAWIKNVRVELKRNIIRKQNREINNKEIYSYMHDIFGKDVITLFDVHYEDMDETRALQKAQEQEADSSAQKSKKSERDAIDGTVTAKSSDGADDESSKMENYEA